MDTDPNIIALDRLRRNGQRISCFLGKKVEVVGMDEKEIRGLFAKLDGACGEIKLGQEKIMGRMELVDHRVMSLEQARDHAYKSRVRIFSELNDLKVLDPAGTKRIVTRLDRAYWKVVGISSAIGAIVGAVISLVMLALRFFQS